MNSYNKLVNILVLIADLYLFRSPIGVTELILYRDTRRYYRTYTYTEVPVGRGGNRAGPGRAGPGQQWAGPKQGRAKLARFFGPKF